MDAYSNLKWLHMYFVTVRHWWYEHLGTWPIISWNLVTLPTSPSGRYCTLLEVWGCWLCKQRVAQKIGNDQGERAHCGAHLIVFINSTVLYSSSYISCLWPIEIFPNDIWFILLLLAFKAWECCVLYMHAACWLECTPKPTNTFIIASKEVCILHLLLIEKVNGMVFAVSIM